MKEHPILFSTPMVQAILEGRKTQTRRVVKPQPKIMACVRHDITRQLIWFDDSVKGQKELNCPYGQPGDRLWVRETWAPINHPELKYRFKADHLNPKSVQWKPSIHLPKAAARIWLQIEQVKVERLQDISEDDAIQEGVEIIDGKMRKLYKNYTNAIDFTYPKLSFISLWQKINGTESWEANPWVWVVKFKVLSTTDKPSFDSAQDDKQPVTSIQKPVPSIQ